MSDAQRSDPIRAMDEVEKAAVEEGVVIAGDAEQIAQETEEISPERRPGDPKTGPSGIRLEILLGYFIILCFAVALGVWVNIPAGIAAAVIGTLAIAINPVVGAATRRAAEREIVAEQHKPEDPDAIVVRTTSKRKEERLSRARP